MDSGGLSVIRRHCYSTARKVSSFAFFNGGHDTRSTETVLRIPVLGDKRADMQ